MPVNNQQGPIVMVIFGAGGDLARSKLVPALYSLFLDHHLPERFAIVGVARKRIDDDGFRNRLKEGVDTFSRRGKADEDKWREFASHLSYFAGDLTDPASGEALGRRLNEFDQEWNGRGDRVFYLEISPDLMIAAAR